MSDGVCDGCGNEKVMLCLNCHGHDEDAEITRLRARLAAWKAEAEAARARLTPLGHAYVTVGPEVPWHPNLAAYAKARAATDAIEKEPQ